MAVRGTTVRNAVVRRRSGQSASRRTGRPLNSAMVRMSASHAFMLHKERFDAALRKPAKACNGLCSETVHALMDTVVSGLHMINNS